MTLQDLKQLYHLRQEIETLRSIRSERVAGVTATNQMLTGMPRAPGCTDKVGNGVSEIADIDAKIGRLLWQCELETERLIDFIAACPDSHVRMIMELRYLRAYSWRKVAYTLGGGNSDSGCKMAVKRYIEKL